MFSNKKGISPLIATVLIIGFTVALAAVIMVWGQGFIKGMQEKTEAGADVQLVCAQDVNARISNVCEDGRSLRITVQNDGSKELTNLTLRLYKSESEISSLTLGGVSSFGVKTFSLGKELTDDAPLPSGVAASEVRQVEGIPIVSISGKSTPCTQSGSLYPLGNLPATADDIAVCS